MGNCFSNEIGTQQYYESKGAAPLPQAKPIIVTTASVRRRASSNSLADSSSSSSNSSVFIARRRTHSVRTVAPGISVRAPTTHRRRASTSIVSEKAAEYVFPGATTAGPPSPRAPRRPIPNAHIITVEGPGSGVPLGPGRRRRRATADYSRSFVEMEREQKKDPVYTRPFESLVHQTRPKTGYGYAIKLPDEMLKDLFYKPVETGRKREVVEV